MTTKKPPGEISTPTGISLPLDLIAQAKEYARKGGYGGLSGLARHLITTRLAEAAEEAQNASNQAKAKAKKKVESGFSKVRKRR